MLHKCKLELILVSEIGTMIKLSLVTIRFLSIWFPGSPFEVASGLGLHCKTETLILHNQNNSINSKATAHKHFLNIFFLVHVVLTTQF
jgi:hypothetical protein